MAQGGGEEITELLARWNCGDRAAYDRVMQLVYHDLRRIARRIDAGRNSDTLQATAVVHELYLRLVDTAHRSFENRSHFFALAARGMRQIVIDRARRNLAGKRGGQAQSVPIEEVELAASQSTVDVVQLDDALTELEAFDARKARMVELRYFGGFTMDEVADAEGVSSETVRRDLRLAESWLLAYLRRD